MKKPVKLEAVLEALELQSDAIKYFLDRRTGIVTTVLSEYLWPIERGEEFPNLNEWQRKELELAMDIEENFHHYATLPEEFEINDYQIMEDFCFCTKNRENREKLLDAIAGKGAFRRFRTAISSLGMEDEWYQFRTERYRQIAIEWCESNNIEYEL